MSEVRSSFQCATADSGIIAPPAGVTDEAGVAATPAELFSIANGREVTPEGVPVSVPELMAAAVVDSLLAAAIAAIFEATALAAPLDVDGVVVLIEELGLVLVLELAALLLLPPVLLFELTNCPADVGNTAEAPEPAEVEGDVDAVDVAAAAVAGAAVDPRRGTDAAAPVEPALM